MKNSLQRQLIMLSKRLLYAFLIQLFMCSVLLANTGNAQRKTIEEVMVSLNLQEKTLLQFFKQVEARTDFKFTYNNDLVDLGQKLTVVDNRRSLYAILESVSRQTNLSFVQVNENIHVKSVEGKKERAVEIAKLVDVVVSGIVTDANGEPIPGVTVSVPATTLGTATNLDGRYSLTVPEGSTLAFSFIGFETQNITVGDRSVIDVVLREDMASLDEVVVVGYGTQKKTSVTAAVSSIKGEEISNLPVTNLSNGLAGRLAGVIVRQGSGEPGRDGSNIYIRGISSTGNSQPLLIVDGIPRDFQKLDPNTIESFTILKDAAAVAPYGVAGANGVVLVTTKRGKLGTPTLTYNGYVGFQNPTARQKHVTPYEFALLKNLAAQNDGLSIPYNQNALQKFQDGSEPDVFPVDDIWKELARKNAVLTNHNIEVSGGTDRARYYASFGYQHQQGLWPSTGENRYNLAVNIDADVTSTTTLSFNLNGRVQKNWYPPIGTSRIFELIGYSHPARGGPLVFSNGMYGKFIMGSIYNEGYADENTTAFFSQISVEQELPFISGLSFKGTVAFDPTHAHNKTWLMPVQLATIDTTQTPHVIKDGVFGQTKSSLTESYNSRYQLTFQGSLNYVKSFGRNNITALGVLETKENNTRNLGAIRRNYDLDMDELNMGSSNQADISNSGSSGFARQLGVVYRLSYDYADKYLFEASGRYDGSYYFAPDQRYGFFPAFSMGWRISEESFMKDLRWLDDLKLRASYGEVGALAGSDYQYLTLYGVHSPAYVIGGSAVQAISESAEPNRSITWERARKTDIGLETSLWNGLINLEADYFFEKRSNMLVSPDVVVPEEYGIGLSQVNAGIMSNQGFEFALSSNYRFSNDFRVSLGTNFTFAKNKLLQVFETSATYENPNRRRTGRPLSTQFGLQSLGFFESEDFDEAGSLKEGIALQPWGQVQPGDIRYADLNNDGRIDNNDETVIGDAAIPQILYGISPSVIYKNFNLELLFQGTGKRDFYLEGEGTWLFFNGMGAFENNLDYWTPENTNARNPRVTSAPTPNNTQRSSFWMENAAYLRLKNVTISYTIPLNVAKRVGIQNARVYASGQNIITWSKIKHFDPEVSQSMGRAYPHQKVMSIGLNLTF